MLVKYQDHNPSTYFCSMLKFGRSREVSRK